MRGNKRFLRLLAGLLAMVLCACGIDGKDEKNTGETELVVFAAASMTETLTEIGRLYEAEHPEVHLVFNFDSSGTLKTQIVEGADCDLFISAGQMQMEQLDITADSKVNSEGLDEILEGTRRDLLQNKVVLCVGDGAAAKVGSFESLAEKLAAGQILMAMGNRDVPVGQYSGEILKYYGLDEKALAASGVLSYGSNAKEVTTQIVEGSVDCGIIYGTDAYSAGLAVTDCATEEMCGQIIYPAAVLKRSKSPEDAEAFLDFLQTDVCMEIFEEVGFSRIGE